MKSTRLLVALSLASIIAGNPVFGQDTNDSDLAKQSQNPVANLISLPLQNNTNFGIGPDDETQNILNIQPVWPFSINQDWNVITRTILSVVSQPNFLTGGVGRTNGLGDTTFTAFL